MTYTLKSCQGIRQPFTAYHFNRLTGLHDGMQIYAELYQNRVDETRDEKVVRKDRPVPGDIIAYSGDDVFALATKVSLYRETLRIATFHFKNMLGVRTDLLRQTDYIELGQDAEGDQAARVTSMANIQADPRADLRGVTLDLMTHEIGTDILPGHLLLFTAAWKSCLQQEGVEILGEIKDYKKDSVFNNKQLLRANKRYVDWIRDTECFPFREARACVSQIALLSLLREAEKDDSFISVINHRIANALVFLSGQVSLLDHPTRYQQERLEGSQGDLLREAKEILGQADRIKNGFTPDAARLQKEVLLAGQPAPPPPNPVIAELTDPIPGILNAFEQAINASSPHPYDLESAEVAVFNTIQNLLWREEDSSLYREFVTRRVFLNEVRRALNQYKRIVSENYERRDQIYSDPGTKLRPAPPSPYKRVMWGFDDRIREFEIKLSEREAILVGDEERNRDLSRLF